MVRNVDAIAFYKSLQFEVEATHVDYYWNSRAKLEAPFDALSMARDLQSCKMESVAEMSKPDKSQEPSSWVSQCEILTKSFQESRGIDV